MLDHPAASPFPNWRRLLALSCLSLLVAGASQAGPLPKIQLGAVPGLLPVQAGPGDSEQQAQESTEKAFTDLNEVLEATRAKLEELAGATAMVAARPELQQELQALKQQNERLATELQQAGAGRTELAELRRQNAQLNQRLARAQSVHEATQADAAKATAEMAAKLEVASGAADQSKAELAELRKELEATRQRLAAADSARAQSAARASEMEQAVARSGTEAERLTAELTAVKEQLGQAASTAVEAERARQAATSEAESVRDGAARVRQELAAATTEIDRFKSANTDLEKQIASWRQDSKSAIETARYNLIVMEEKIEELNAALGVAGPKEAKPAQTPKTQDPAADEPRAAEPQAPSATTQRPAPEPARATAAGGAAKGATTKGATTKGATTERAAAELSAPEGSGTKGSGTERAGTQRAAPELSDTQLAMVGPRAAPSEAVRSKLTRFRANIGDLNKRALDAAGVDLFSGIEPVGDHAVHVSTTTAWDLVPPAGQLSYLNSLLDYWVAALGGEGPAVVRIVDQDDRVLLEKSWP